MKRLLLLSVLTAAASGAVSQETILDEIIRVGAGKTRTLDLHVEQNGRVVCEHHVVEGSSGVRLLLLKRGESEKWLRGEAHNVLEGTAFTRDGALTHRVSSDDSYRIVLDNRLEGRGPALVKLRVSIVRGEAPVAAISADPVRGQFAVWVSVFLFLIISAAAGWRIRRAWIQRPDW